MTRIFRKVALASIAIFATTAAVAQKQSIDYNQIPAKKSPLTEEQLKRWSHLDLEKDTVPGMSVDRAYSELLGNKKSQKVIVGVIDSGVDYEHEDLKSVMWTNAKEIAGNGKDDDKNGYVDDIHGWNFLGDVVNENLEMTRILKGKDDGSETYKRAEAAYAEKVAENLQGKQQVDFIFDAKKKIDMQLGKDTYTFEEVSAIKTTDRELSQAKMIMMAVIQQAGPNFAEEILAFKDQIDDMVAYNLNKDYDGRKILGDNPDDFSKKYYGNNNVTGPSKDDALHGTHVAGIIAQVRGNGKGGDGVADNVAIMAIRAVPNGDEYDKDIALAIRYAVDNGAKVINGSFGKAFSTHSDWVQDAMKYAASKDVLIVHAAGNDGHDIDLEEYRSYPNDTKDGKEITDNVLTIGALNNEFPEGLVAPFSNYGSKNVDIFAPGMKIYATTPNGTYKYEQGTSMASPNAAGVAALVRSYYPNLSASEVKKIIVESGTPLSVEVELGEKSEKRSFANASKSGRIVNAYNALKMAEQMSAKKLPKQAVKG
jgi:subtilisin family serine protease